MPVPVHSLQASAGGSAAWASSGARAPAAAAKPAAPVNMTSWRRVLINGGGVGSSGRDVEEEDAWTLTQASLDGACNDLCANQDNNEMPEMCKFFNIGVDYWGCDSYLCHPAGLSAWTTTELMQRVRHLVQSTLIK
jgi:hypothetical protein